MDLTNPIMYDEFQQCMLDRLPIEMVENIISYNITSKYNTYHDNHTWDDIENMLYQLMEFDVSFCEHIFKIFRSIGDRITIFYPTAWNDTDVILKPHKFGGTRIRGICLSRHIWFEHDYYKMPQGGKKYYLNDELTNYDDVIRMTMTILKKADEWYWTYYAGEEDILLCITSIYETLEKYIDMTDEQIYNDHTIKKASAHYSFEEFGCSEDPNIFYVSDVYS